MFRVKQVWIDIDLGLANLVVIRKGNRGTPHIRKPRTNKGDPEIIQILLLARYQTCSIGTLDASYFWMLEGKVPGGILRRIVCTTAVICDIASSTFTVG